MNYIPAFPTEDGLGMSLRDYYIGQFAPQVYRVLSAGSLKGSNKLPAAVKRKAEELADVLLEN